MEKRIEQIRQIHKESHEIYGAPKIAKKMREWGDLISDKTVGNYMRKIGIKACYIKHSIKTTIQSDFNRKLRNILKQQFNPKEPNAVWCSDITSIWTNAGFVYLTSIIKTNTHILAYTSFFLEHCLKIAIFTCPLSISAEKVLTTTSENSTWNKPVIPNRFHCPKAKSIAPDGVICKSGASVKME